MKIVTSFLVAIAMMGSVAALSGKTSSSGKSLCAARPIESDIDEGIDLATDLSCFDGGVGCLGTVCRYCKTKETNNQRIDALPLCSTLPRWTGELRATASSSNTVLALSASTKSEHAGALEDIEKDGSKNWIIKLSIGTGGVAAVAAMAFVAKRTADKKRAREAPTPTSLAYRRRSSVFAI